MAEHLSNDYRQVLLSLAPYDNVRLFIILSNSTVIFELLVNECDVQRQRGEMFTTHGQPIELLRAVVDEVRHAYTSHLRALVRERAAVGNYAFELLVQPDTAAQHVGAICLLSLGGWSNLIEANLKLYRPRL